MADSRTLAGNMLDEPGVFCSYQKESELVLNPTPNYGRVCQGMQEPTGRALKGKSWNNLNNKIKWYWIIA